MATSPCGTGTASPWSSTARSTTTWRLRRELQALGHRFETGTDTEVVLAAYAEWGVDCLAPLQRHVGPGAPRPAAAGAAARPRSVRREAALLPGGRGTARLRFRGEGVHRPRRLEAPGEPRAPARLPGLERQRPRSPTRSSRGCGSSLVGTSSRSTSRPSSQRRRCTDCRRAAAATVVRAAAPARRSQGRTARRELRGLLADAVRLRLRSDVPVGSCLSGGLDSSSIVGLMSQLLAAGGGRVSTFTATSADPAFDESALGEDGDRGHGLHPHLRHADAPGALRGPRRADLAPGRAVPLLLHLRPVDRLPGGAAGRGGRDARRAGSRRDAVRLPGVLRRLPGRPPPARQRRGVVARGPGTAAGDRVLPAPIDRLHGRLPLSLPPGRRRSPGWPRLRRPRLDPCRAEGVPSTTTRSGARVDAPAPCGRCPSHRSRPPTSPCSSTGRTGTPWPSRSRPACLSSTTGWSSSRSSSTTRRRWAAGSRKAILRRAMRGVVPDRVLDRRDKMGFVTAEPLWMKRDLTASFRDALEESIRILPGILDPFYLGALRRGGRRPRAPSTSATGGSSVRGAGRSGSRWPSEHRRRVRRGTELEELRHHRGRGASSPRGTCRPSGTPATGCSRRSTRTTRWASSTATSTT